MPKVVIADDSATLRRIVSTVLTRSGFEVVEAEDGVEAVQAVFRTQPDAVVLDVQMPRLSGYVAARVLKDDWQTAHIPVVMLTSLDSATDRYWGANTGAERYLTKDFQPGELTDAVSEVMAAAPVEAALRPDPLELTDDDVMARVVDLLDRKLFETSVAAEVMGIASDAHGLEPTISSVLGVLARVVDYDLASVLLLEERTAYVGVAHPCAHRQYDDFVRATADSAAAAATAGALSPGELDVRVADPEGHLGSRDDAGARDDADDDADDIADDDAMGTFLSMPLRGHGGQVVGVLALSSERSSAFGETALSTLRLIEGPVAVVVDNARLAGVRTA